MLLRLRNTEQERKKILEPYEKKVLVSIGCNTFSR